MSERINSLDPRTYQKIVGSTFANADHQPLITIGGRSWNRWQLGRLGCPHPAAATRVQRVLKTLQITSVEDFLGRVHEFGRFKALGVTSYWVVLALAADCGARIEKVHGDDRSFSSIHREALIQDAEGHKTKKRRPRRH
jgi:hypothetical protein